MPPKNKKHKIVGKNLSDEWAQAFLNCNHPIPITKKILGDKPHFLPVKFDDIPASINELKDLSLTLINSLLMEEEKSEKEKHATLLCALCNFVKLALNFEEFYDLVHIGKIVNHLSLSLTLENISHKVKNQISQLCERYVEISIIDEHLKASQCLINYLLDLTLVPTENIKKIDIKRIWALRKFIDVMEVDVPHWEDILDKYLSTVTNNNYLTSREGQHVIGYLLRKDVSFAKKIHEMIMKNIPNLSKGVAAGYGQAYFVAWTMAEKEVQEAVQFCIQDIMMKVLNIPRGGLDFPKPGANAFAVLSTLHGCRRMRNFSHLLNDLYSPLLWRFLRDDDPWKRCNGAQVFFDVFPLEHPFSSTADNANYLERQIAEMKSLLLDNSHFVRILAIKGVCQCLTHSIELFTVMHVKNLMQLLALELTQDGSSYLVRKAVFEGFESMLSEPSQTDDEAPQSSVLVLESVLPTVQKSFYDVSEKVRKAYVKMLLKLKEKSKYVTIRYWHVNNLQDIILRLSTEGPVVGELISKLVIDQVISKGNPKVDVIVSRLFRLMDWNFEGVKNAFKYSQKALSVHDAYRLIVTLVGTVRKSLKEYLDSLNSDLPNPKRSKTIMTKGKEKQQDAGEEEEESEENEEEDIIESAEPEIPAKKVVDQDSSISSVSTSTSTCCPSEQKSEYDFLGKHEYVRGLIQLATVIWVVFRKEISEEPEYLNNLYNLACVSIPMFLKHYKGTTVYYATVSFSSLIPIQKLRPVSTVSSACISELKEVTESTDSTKLECLIYALCSWNRAHDVLDLAAEWLNFAFREQNLNNTAMNKNSAQKVRFLQINGKPLLALRLLDILFSDVINEQRILMKNYEQLHDFYTCLERILIIIERKMAGDASFNKPGTLLTDEFIARAFSRYLRLMHSLHRPNPPELEGETTAAPFDAGHSLLKTTYWATDVLCPRIPLQEDADCPPPLAAVCCLAILRESSLAVSLGETTDEHCRALCLFTKDLLSIEGTWFFEEAFYAMQAIIEYAEAFVVHDNWQLLSKIVPSLFEKGLSVMSNIDITVASLRNVVKNLQKFKSALFSLPKALQRKQGYNSDEFIDIFRTLVHTSILLVLQEINYEESIVTHSKLEDLPCFATIILRTIVLKSVFVKHLLPTLLYFMKKFSQEQEGMLLLSTLSIMFTVIIATQKRFLSSQLEDSVQDAFVLFSKYRPKEKPENNDSFSDASVEIDVTKAGLPVLHELASHLNCALFKPNPLTLEASLQAQPAAVEDGQIQQTSPEQARETGAVEEGSPPSELDCPPSDSSLSADADSPSMGSSPSEPVSRPDPPQGTVSPEIISPMASKEEDGFSFSSSKQQDISCSSSQDSSNAGTSQKTSDSSSISQDSSNAGTSQKTSDFSSTSQESCNAGTSQKTSDSSSPILKSKSNRKRSRKRGAKKKSL